MTFFFTDIEGSTRMLEELGERYRVLQDAHNAIMRDAIAAGSGVEIRTVGDGFFAVFASAPDAVRAAVAAQRVLAGDEDLASVPVRVRVGLHTGEGRRGGDDYIGIDVNRAARISDVAHGGQVVMSEVTNALVRTDLPDGVTIRDLGHHSLKDLTDKVHLSQLVIDGLPSDFPTLRTLEAVPNNLPANLDPFVGRDHDVEEARKLLEHTRLLTLTGPGGVGKSRLSYHLAAELIDSFPEGAYVVHLSALDRAELVPSAIIEAMGVPAASTDMTPAEHILGHLRDRSVLLVLDNFEQVLDAAPFVSQVLQRCPGVKVIVTSRAALHIHGEQELEVPPLDIPDLAMVPVDALSGIDAVQLFVTRAQAVRPSFQIDESNAADIAELTRRLDGLPLAIELAAAWVKVLPPRTILERLGDRVLGSGRRDAMDHQRTLFDTIDWSYNLLEEPYRRLFERLAVFSGTAGLEQIEAVCGGADELGVDILTGISVLVDHSLLRQVERLGEPRYRMLLTIRDHAATRLEERGETGMITQRHFDAYLAWAEAADPHLLGGDAGAWLDRFSLEHENLRSALHHCLATGHADGARTLAHRMWRFWHMRGHLHDARQELERILALPDGSPLPRANALEAAGGIAYWQGDMDAARTFYQEALDIHRELGDDTAIANALYNLAFPHMFEGTGTEGLPFLEESLELFTALGDQRGIASVSWGIGNAYSRTGEYAEAHDHFERAIEAFEKLDDRFNLGWAHYSMGEVDVGLGHLDEALDHFDQGIRFFVDVDDRSAVVMFMSGFAAVAALQGEKERAVRLAGALAGLQERTGTGLVDVGSGMTPLIRGHDIEGMAADMPEAFASGKTMTAQDAVRYALREWEPPDTDSDAGES